MTDWTPELANEIRERCDVATPGPWQRTPNDGIKAWLLPPEDIPAYQRIIETVCWQDSVFVAHARTDLPAALDRIDAQDEEIERLKDQVESQDDYIGTMEEDLRNFQAG